FAIGDIKTGFGAGQALGALIAGDFNRDGRLDLAAANTGSNDVSVLLGNGDGTFQEQKRFAVGEVPNWLATADFSTGAVLGAVSSQRGLPSGLAMADFNGDGIPDLVVTNYRSRAISVLLGNGDGNFGAELRLAAGFGPYLPIVGDFNGDGHIDIADTNV